jgi:hypothetical protein
MKKLITILCAAVLTINISAQVQFGLVTGLNVSAIGITEPLFGVDMPGFSHEISGKTGMHFGGVAHFPLGNVVELRTGLIYNQKGGGESLTVNDPFWIGAGYTGSMAFNYNLDYLEIPVDVAFKLGNVFALSAGTYIAFVMNKSVTGTYTGIYNDPTMIDTEEIDSDIMEILDRSVKGMDMGLNFGMSCTIADHFLISTKYSVGLMDILDTDIPIDNGVYNLSESPDADWVNGYLSFSFGYVFGGY